LQAQIDEKEAIIAERDAEIARLRDQIEERAARG
jgi:hypothetical protein